MIRSTPNVLAAAAACASSRGSSAAKHPGTAHHHVRAQPGSTRHERDCSSAWRLSRANPLVPCRRRSLSTQPGRSIPRATVEALQSRIKMPSALSRPPRSAHMHRASRKRRGNRRGRRKHQIPIALATQPVLNLTRLRALALFGRRPLQCVARPRCRRPKTCTIAAVSLPNGYV